MARRRTKKNDPAEFIPTPDKQMTHPSGFCMTGHHNNCRYTFLAGKCGCDCHVAPVVEKKRGRPKKVQVIAPTAIIVDEVQDPRPWKRN